MPYRMLAVHRLEAQDEAARDQQGCATPKKKAPPKRDLSLTKFAYNFASGRRKSLARVSLALATALTAAKTSALALIIAAARNDRVSDVVHRATN